MATALLATVFSVLAPPAAASGVGCSTNEWETDMTHASETHCMAMTQHNGKIVCLGSEDDYYSYYNDPNHPSETTEKHSCSGGV